MTVNSPLEVHNQDLEAIKQITYDKEEQCLLIESKMLPMLKKNTLTPKGYNIGDWIFVEKDGFYPKNQQGLLTTPKIYGNIFQTVI